MCYLADIAPDSPLATFQAASRRYCIALGPRAGQKVLRLRTVPGRDEKPSATVPCADAHGEKGGLNFLHSGAYRDRIPDIGYFVSPTDNAKGQPNVSGRPSVDLLT